MTSRVPDVLAYTFDDARQAIADAGWTVGEVAETAAPRRALVGPRRVVRQQVHDDGSVALVVCGERTDAGRA